MDRAWRLICDGPVAGRLNMAIDRAIQVCRAEGSAPPTVRFYRWARPTVTLGRFQPAQDIDSTARERRGVDVARRYTGGRGVLHDDELTYSVVAGVSDGIPRTVTASYATLSRALLESYRLVGVDAQLVAHDRAKERSGACYLQSTRADLSFRGAKLSGSAQVWLGDTVLQHGSFVIDRDLQREKDLFGLDDVETERLRSETATIVSALGRRVEPDDLLARCIEGFSTALGVTLLPGSLNAREAQVTRELLASEE
jgi:lipoate-protein ligase A